MQDSVEALPASAHGALLDLEGETVRLVVRQRLVPTAVVTLTSLKLGETFKKGALFVVPLDLGLGDDLPRVSEGYAVSGLIESALDDSWLPAVESLRGDSEVSGESESTDVARTPDKTLRYL